MPDFSRTSTISASPDALFDFLSDVHNLPRYFSRMTSAEPAEGEAVHTTASVNGQDVEGEAWFRVSSSDRTLQWGSEGPSNYSGRLSVAEAGPSSSNLTVSLHTERVQDDSDGEIASGLEETLANVQRLVEQAPDAPSS